MIEAIVRHSKSPIAVLLRKKLHQRRSSSAVEIKNRIMLGNLVLDVPARSALHSEELCRQWLRTCHPEMNARQQSFSSVSALPAFLSVSAVGIPILEQARAVLRSFRYESSSC